MHLTGPRQSIAARAGIEPSLPLQRFQVTELVLHPYNIRPASGATELAELTEQLRKVGQLDPIHVVPYKGRLAIMDGQRRWLAARAAGLSELNGWLYPEPSDPFEIYAFGQLLQDSRAETTALDQALVWARMIDDGLFTNAAELAARARVDGSRVSRILAILRSERSVLDEIRAEPARFSERHLYAIFQIYAGAGTEAAVNAARAVALAPKDRPFSARRLESSVDELMATGTVRVRRRKKNGYSIAIRSTGGSRLGNLKVFADGRIAFAPERPLSDAASERVGEAVRAALTISFDQLCETLGNLHEGVPTQGPRVSSNSR